MKHLETFRKFENTDYSQYKRKNEEYSNIKVTKYGSEDYIKFKKDCEKHGLTKLDPYREKKYFDLYLKKGEFYIVSNDNKAFAGNNGIKDKKSLFDGRNKPYSLEEVADILDVDIKEIESKI